MRRGHCVVNRGLGFLTTIVAIVLGLGVAKCDRNVGRDFFLGPGAFSFDARMFGRREIRIPAVPQPINKQMEV